MSWMQDLKQASFRGVPFHVDTVERKPGFQSVLQDYPFQEQPTVSRQGKATEEIKFSAYVVGPDYVQQCKALENELNKPGAGALVHPTSGTMMAMVAAPYTIRESPTTEGGIARFDLTFVLAQERRYPMAAGNTSMDVLRAAKAGTNATLREFAQKFDLANSSGWVVDSLQDRIMKAVDIVNKTIGPATKGINGFSSQITRAYQVLRDGMNGLVRQPVLLADAIANLIQLPTDLKAAAARDVRAVYQDLFEVASRIDGGVNNLIRQPQSLTNIAMLAQNQNGMVMFGSAASSLGSDAATQQNLAKLSNAIDQLFESLVTTAWVQACATSELSNYDEALALRCAVTSQITKLLQTASLVSAASSNTSGGMARQSWHDAMQAVLTASLTDLQRRSVNLNRLMNFMPQAWTPVWTISYQLYGTAIWADEILALNPHIEHPLLVPPGQMLKVAQHD